MSSQPKASATPMELDNDAAINRRRKLTSSDEILADLRRIVQGNKGQISRMFNDFDSSKDATVGKKELHRALLKMGYDPPMSAVADLFHIIDRDGEGGIAYQELFIALKANAAKPKQAATSRPPRTRHIPSIKTLLHLSRLTSKPLPTPEEQKKMAHDAFTGPLARKLSEVLNSTFNEAVVPGANVDIDSLCQRLAAKLNPAFHDESTEMLTSLQNSGSVDVAELLAESPQLRGMLPPVILKPPEESYGVCEFVSPGAHVAISVGSGAASDPTSGVELENLPSSGDYLVPADDGCDVFTDPSFPPAPSSLCPAGDFAAAGKDRWATLGWARAAEIRKGQGRALTFAGGGDSDSGKRLDGRDTAASAQAEILPGDVSQGELSDCYFLAAVSV